MPLILRIRSYQNESPSTPLSIEFSASGGTVGRTPDNDLVLQDPSKTISRKHARVDYRSGSYYLTDTGSNPSLVNGVILGAGAEIRLNNGDLVTIGDYVIEVETDTERTRAFPTGIGS